MKTFSVLVELHVPANDTAHAEEIARAFVSRAVEYAAPSERQGLRFYGIGEHYGRATIELDEIDAADSARRAGL